MKEQKNCNKRKKQNLKTKTSVAKKKQTNKTNQALGKKDKTVGEVVRIISLHQCDQRLILLFYSAPRYFPTGTPVFLSHQKPIFAFFVVIFFDLLSPRS